VTGDHLQVAIDQYRNVKTKFLDTSRDLLYWCLLVYSWVSRIELKFADAAVNYRQCVLSGSGRPNVRFLRQREIPPLLVGTTEQLCIICLELKRLGEAQENLISYSPTPRRGL